MAVGIVALAGGEHGRHDDGAGMHRSALERVVEILAMRRGAVDEGGAGRAHAPGMADRGAGPIVVPAGERAGDIVLVARGDAEADHVDQQIFAFLPHGGRQARRIERHDAVGQMLGDGELRELAHGINYCAGGPAAKAGNAIDEDDNSEGETAA